MRSLVLIGTGFVLAAALFITTSVLIAWSGPTSAPPNGNVAAPVNVGDTDQVKNAGLSVNALAVFGNVILSGVSRYLNFGATAGSAGYGFRDNSGTMEVKDSSGAWSRFATTTSNGTVPQIRFSDGTTQATAAVQAVSDAGTLCGAASFTVSGYTECDPAMAMYGSVSVATCKAVNVAQGCPTGYSQRAVKTGYQPGSSQSIMISSPLNYCVATCVKN
jgi:hypothetical protein